MQLKLVARMAEYVADADPSIRWTRPFIGVWPSDQFAGPRVQEMMRLIPLQYRPMCSVIENAINDRYLTAILKDIHAVSIGQPREIEEETEDWMFSIRQSGVAFEGKFGQGSFGEVDLNRFELAVRVFRDFLMDCRRQSVEIPFNL